MSRNGQRLFRGFGADEYTGPGSPNYNYATPAQQQAEDMADAYTGPAYSDPNRNYVGPGTVNTDVIYQSGGGSSESSERSSNSGPGFLDTLFGTKQSENGLVGSLVNIFGQIMGRNGQPLPPPPPTPSVPIWVWLAIPVALVGVVVIARKPKSVAEYRRRKSRR